MRKIAITIAFGILVPVLALAALKAPVVNTPLQPLPENTSPNIQHNTNTPGNEYNQTQQQVEDQRSNEDSDVSDIQTPDNLAPVDSKPTSDSNLYVVLIIFCSIGFVLMLGWIYYRYRIKED
jgi:hypothetical protein